MLEVLEDSTFKALKKIRHGFFTRLGGVSTGFYLGLNCADRSKDDPSNVKENQRRAMAYLGFPLEALAIVKNIHGNRVTVVDKVWDENHRPIADAMVTKKRQIVLGSYSADCPIVLLADDIENVIGIAHAGWRGAKSGVLEATVNNMMSLGAKPEHIVSAISPCIAQDSYEVNADFYQQFLEEDKFNQAFFKDSPKENYYLFNLLDYVKHRLKKLNLKSISSEVAFNTYEDERRFFSCRRAFHKGEPDFGGHLSCIYFQ